MSFDVALDSPVLPMLQRTVVVGAGPVGALAALYAARRGDLVEVYELRADLREPGLVPLNFTKSINLALSERGINSVREARCSGLLKSVLDDSIPMTGRMIHGQQSGKLFEHAQAYDVHGHAIHAVDRSALNKKLLDELERMPNVKLMFNHKLTGADFNRNLAWFEDQRVAAAPKAKESGGTDATPDTTSTAREQSSSPAAPRPREIEVPFDFMIGADGAHSAARFHMMKFARVSYQQEYIETMWCEFHIPPADGTEDYPTHDGFRISPNHLHIWPAGSMMFIAIPSTDKSFTCTLFMSASEFEQMDRDVEVLIPFFVSLFPGVVNKLIRAADLLEQYRGNPHLPLISIKCEPYHYGASVVVVGDAAHAMVPFYGQGMNAGLEDVRVLYDTIDKYCPPMHKSRHSFTAEGRRENRGLALHEYSSVRRKDAHTVNDLAMGNYQEMRSDVTSRLYLLRKGIEEKLSLWFPGSGFKTQYSRISFSNERYSDVLRNVHWQHAVLNGAGAVALSAVFGTALHILFSWKNR